MYDYIFLLLLGAVIAFNDISCRGKISQGSPENSKGFAANTSSWALLLNWTRAWCSLFAWCSRKLICISILFFRCFVNDIILRPQFILYQSMESLYQIRVVGYRRASWWPHTCAYGAFLPVYNILFNSIVLVSNLVKIFPLEFKITRAHWLDIKIR